MQKTSLFRALFCLFGAALLAAALLSVPRLDAQPATAAITGTITDATGAVVAGAAVQVKNTATGVVEATTSNEQGRYNIPDLPIGSYEAQASKAGFQTAVHKGITLTVGSQPVVDFMLTVGQASQTITVEGEVTQVQTESSSVGQLVSDVQMRELPLNGRNFEQLITLAPGVQQIAASGGSYYGTSNNYSIAGSRPEGQAFLLDNTDIQGFWNHGTGSGATGNALGVEAIAEFQTLTDTYSAQFGGNGAVINAISKSGTNAVHGSAYEFLRNSALDARNFFDPNKVPEFRRNQFGGSVGGPIKKDKMFFFVNYEGLRQLLGESRIAFVPDANAHAGYLPNGSGGLTFVGVNPNVAPTLALYPLPTTVLGGGIGQLTEVANQLAHENYVLSRYDWNISNRDGLFVRVAIDRADLTDPFYGSVVPLWPERDTTANDYATIEERHTVSPTVVNIFNFSYVRPAERAVSTNNTPALQFFPNRQDGTVAVSGISTIGASIFTPFALIQNKFTPSDNVFWTHGVHSISFGFSLERIQDNTNAPGWVGGAYTFNSLQAFLQNQPFFLLGALPNGGNASRDFRELLLMPYFNDQWKVTSRLTLNLGLRYSPTTNPGYVGTPLYAITNPLTSTGFTEVPHVYRNNPSLKNFDPRFGFAYDLFGDHKTAIRGGFGMFHDVIQARVFASAYYFAPPYGLATQVFPAYPTPFTSITPSLASAAEGIDYNSTNTPYMMQYNFNIQRELGGSTVLTVGYVGSRGVHLMAMVDQNPPMATIDANGVYHFGSLVNGQIVTNPRLNPNLGQLSDRLPNGNSNYNSLQINLDRRFSRGLQVQLAYTWSKSLDDNSVSYGLEGGGAAQNVENPYNRRIDYGLSTFNRAQSVRASSVYAFPFRGNAWVEGWQMSGIFTAVSGPPFTVFDGFDEAGLQTGSPRPNLNPGCSANPIIGNVHEWYNPACFSLQAPGTVGNLGRDTLIGPGTVDLDFALLKDTPVRKISEQFRVQFRAEFFNILNHPNFGLPNPNLFVQATGGGGAPSPTAAHITTVNPLAQARQIQFGLKVLF